LGYLIAIKCGAKIIFESDDDNLLETNDIYFLPKIVQQKHVPWIGFHRQRSPFINIYGSFGHPNIWPRGFPIDELRNVTEDGWHSVRRNLENNTYAYIQQYLADLDPDVDAIYRLSHPLSIGRIKFDRDQPPIALEPFTFSPYNTQNTITYYEAFWGLYLPITTTFRVCDIWRSFWVQRLLWDIGGRLIFGTSTVKQVRNSHSFIKDMDDEYQLYHESGSFVRFLVSWSSSYSLLWKRIAQLARDIAQAGFWKSKEVNIMDAWLADLHSVGYSFPSIISPSSPLIIQKRAAVCVTGFAECIQEAWVPTWSTIRNHLQGNIDAFLFLSSSHKLEKIPFDVNLKQIRAYLNSTVTILYEDRVIDPHIPSNCKTFYYPPMSRSHVIPYYQQLWGLAECFDLVKEYEQKMNIRYEFLIRARPDSVLNRVPQALEPVNNSTLVIPNENGFGGYNDRFAIGSMSIMEKYMRRWHDLSRCYIENLHAESFLKLLLNRFNINVQLMKTLSYEQQPHGVGRCH
ncbi:unnamed protein product, partial [Rotaria sp. Silwood2]